ncbi:type I site-specific deoxyribonuclease, HsdR family [Nostoc sp. PCC 7524]|uniref:type I restriction endonuclease subunit R n=1 Tax=Nostoc sp. (strain ATCC 29411 / PCC 7524) TaxID=28072 RepID=UPI00029EFB08|nr:HsdR family type I site-specific deoxyribonuclease [Nostoc sp. PCC 7524]AFY47533.1 type I site-specific deoxyribonuclease, HsdR family [Nostoc sp. PCC 7524]
MPQQTPEYIHVEKPTIEQLTGMGWQYIEGNWDNPAITERDNFKQVLLTQRLKAAIKRINLDDNGNPWLDDIQVQTAVSQLERLGANKLMEANQAATELLLKGTTVLGQDGKQHTVHFIEFNPEYWQHNDFLVINQYRLDPPWATGNRGFIVPDIVLLVNGIPLVVIECKSPNLDNPITEAIQDLLKYSNQRGSSQPEGAEKLFHYNLLMIAASRGRAAAGTIGANYEHYVEWKDTIPSPQGEIAAQLGVSELNSRQTLIAGMLNPANLIDILHNFTLFKTSGGRTIKIVPRYQQYRAVHKALHRLQHNQTRAQHGTDDQRGGIIWHTQGSGKSLTMVYLIRKIRTIPELRRFKIVVVTDRRDLERQLADTAVLTGEPLQKAKKVRTLENYLQQPGAGLVFGMIQKFKGGEDSEEEAEIEPIPKNLNPSENILVLIDEAHRSHAKTLHTNLLEALPNCVRIGFTGTPIVKAAKKTTLQIFGSFIDEYNIRKSQEDKVTLPIIYEGLEARGTVTQGDDLDQLFEIIFADKTPEERALIKAKYATKTQVGEARELIKAKAKSMLFHYIERILAGGFKAQVVASTRLAAVRYQEAFVEAQREIVQQLEHRAPILQSLDAEALELRDAETRFFAQALPHLEIIRKLEFATVISGDKGDDPSWKKWTDKSQQEINIEKFKKSLDQDCLAILIVKNMLLTGFDAPLEQVLYLDRSLKEYELLQAIARVNRVYNDKKTEGLVVDYYGVDIAAALSVYENVDTELALFDIRAELPKLRDRHQQVMALFTEKGCTIDDVDACVDLLRDERLRVEFNDCFKDFLNTLDTILPRPEARQPYNFVRDAKKIGFIKKAVADLYRDEKLNIVSAKEKVRALIDQYIESQGIDPKVPPIDIMSLDFKTHVQRHSSIKAQAAEMEFAARHHINVNYEEDPVYYRNLSERLTEILESLADNWEAKVEALRKYIEQIQAGRTTNETGLDPKTQMPFLNILGEHSQKPLPELAQATVEIVEHIRQEVKRINWSNQIIQEDLRKWIAGYLDEHDLVSYEQLEEVADKLVQLATRNRDNLMV